MAIRVNYNVDTPALLDEPGRLVDSGAARALVMGLKLAKERPPGRVGPLSEIELVVFARFTFEGPLSGLGWALLSLDWAPSGLKLAIADNAWTLNSM